MSCMGSMSVSSCRCCMFLYCVHHVAVLNAAFCMNCSLISFSSFSPQIIFTFEDATTSNPGVYHPSKRY